MYSCEIGSSPSRTWALAQFGLQPRHSTYAAARGSMPVLHLHLPGRALRTHTLDLELDVDGAGLLETQLTFDHLALLQRCGQIGEHDVIAAGLELDLLAGRDLEAALQLAHLHHAVFHLHLVHLEAPRPRHRAAHQAIRLAAGIDDGHEPSGDLG